MSNQSTKTCPKCGCTDLSLLHGEDKKLCTGCGHEIEWPLDEGQKSLFKHNVVGAVDEKGNPIPFALYASDIVPKPFRVSDGEIYSMGKKSPETRAAYQEAVERVLAIGQAADHAVNALNAIHALLNGTEWDSSTCSAIAEVLQGAGYHVDEVSQP